MLKARRNKRGITLLEAMIAVFMLLLITAIFLGFTHAIRTGLRNTKTYSELRLYALNAINRIQTELELGTEIDAENYNDTGEESGVMANIYITNTGVVHGKYMYRVDLHLIHIETGTIVKTTTILREGCIAYAP